MNKMNSIPALSLWLNELKEEKNRLSKLQEEYEKAAKRYDDNPKKFLKETGPSFLKKIGLTSGTLLAAGTLVTAGPLLTGVGAVAGTGLIIGQLFAGWTLTGFAGLKKIYQLDNALHEHKQFKKYQDFFYGKLLRNKEFQGTIDDILRNTKAKLSSEEQEQLKLLKDLLYKEEGKLLLEKNLVKIAAYDLRKGLFSYRASVLIKNLNKNLMKDPNFMGEYGVTLDNFGLPLTKPEDGLQEIHNQLSFLKEKKKYILALLGGYPSEKEYFGRQRKSVFDEDNKELVKIVKAIQALEQKQDNILAEANKEGLIENKILMDETQKLKAELERKDAELQQLKSEKEVNQELYDNIYRGLSMS